MKTDGEYFARKILNDLIQEGLTPLKAGIARDEIVRTAEAKGWPDVSHNAEARICSFSADMQSVFVDDEGIAMLHTGIRREYQPLLRITNFGRQGQTRRAA